MVPRGSLRAAGSLLLCCALAAARAAPRRTPSFDGQVAENRAAGTRVRGLSIPLTRLAPGPWCAQVRGRRWRLQLLGAGHSHFRVWLHARTARVLLRTARPLDREARALYALRLALCCRRCLPRAAAPAELAAITVRVLDDNDNAPRFAGGPRRGVTRLRVEETLALGSAVWQAHAEDADAGANAELRYFALPRSEHFFVVPRSGRVLLVRSLLHLRAPITLRLYARDRGRPPLLSAPLELEVLPQPKRLPIPRDAARRRRRSVLVPPRAAARPLSLSVPEDARPGIRLATLVPERFASAWFELVSPPVEESPVRVERESGVVTLRAGLDREAVAHWKFVVRVQERPGGEDRFEVEKDTGWIKTTGLPLVKDKEYLLTVLAADKLGSRGSPASVSVIAGFRPPQFTNISYFVYVPESMPQGKSFLTVTAVSYQKKSLSYSLLTNPSGLFSIDQATGDISLTQSVDYESDQHQYLLLVRAQENEQFSSAAEVLVVITDVNDCAPEFHQSIYSKAGVPETVTMTTALLQVTATDCDSKENAELLYYTLSQDFSITSHGTIFPATRLDYERPNHLYEFIIMAVDKGEEPKTGTATVRIHVSNVNDEAPEFSQAIYRSFVSEDAVPNTLVATVNAIDPDGDGVTYSILSGNQKRNFVIDPKKGLVRLRSSPFLELQGTYVLNVTAADDNASGGPHSLTSTAQVVVKIDDVNNNKPVFQKCQYYQEHAFVLENQPSGTVVLQVEATDADEGANGLVKYGLVQRDGVLPAFSVHPDTGVLTTVQVFDREKQREYPITVTATDQAMEPLIGMCQINVIILDQNDNDPRFENTHYEYFLREDTRVGTSFLRVAAHDDDYSSNAAITYSIANEEPNYLQINPTTGWVFVNQPISQRSSIIREIIATDGGNRSSKVDLAVIITSAKTQPPQWERDSYEVVIPENTTRDASILTIKATSPLGDPRVTYNLEEGLVPETNMPVRFYLTSNRRDGSASILVAEPLDYETTKSFLLRVRAQTVAAVPLAAFTTIYISVTDVNDNVPFFTSPVYEALVTEGADVGTFVVQVSAVDLDLGQNGEITYSMLHDSSRDYTYFRLDSQTGSIYTASVFDREKKVSYLLEVKSVDGSESARPGKHGKPNSDTAYVCIFISDVNDNKPVFTRSVYEVNVDEDQDVGSTIITVSATDEDEGTNAKLRYQITSGNTGGVLGVKSETGAIFIAQPLDYEETKMYEIRMLASDGKWEDYAVIIINVMNKNDEIPVFSISEYYGSIIEELDGLPVFVLQVLANDPDSDVDEADLRYSLHGHGAADVFTIDERTGSIYSNKMLDREERALWRFVVLATDEGGGGLTGFADVIINVWDINDNAPMFTCMPDDCNGNVFENSPAETLVMEMGAVDCDDPNVGLNAVLTYRITENVRNEFGADMFNINADTGTIYVAGGMLDRERTENYFLTVEARDGGGLTGTGTATVWIADINDHVPKFIKNVWQAVIPENSAIDSEVVQVCATDADFGENAGLIFSIVRGDPDQKFYIGNDKEWQCAAIRLKKKLDFENAHERQFNLTIAVEDLDFSSIAVCLIEVEDSNDHSPIFPSQFIQTSPFFENTPVGTTVTTVRATDKDSGLNGNIIYSIQSDSDPMRQFAVDQYGHLVVANALDHEVIQKYSLIVQASDEGTPARTGSVTVLINLLDVNDNGPRFEAPYMPVAWENILKPEIVSMNHTSKLLHAFDPDSEENGPPFMFSLPPDYQSSLDFSLTDNRNNTATVTALRSFDREKQKVFHLPVVITDSGIPAMSSTNTLTITIGDENDNCHESGHKEVYVYSYKGKWSTAVLGEVFAPDQDDWDNKTFLSEGKMLKSFRLNQKTGSLMMVDNTPQGMYNLKVRVSDGVCPDVISTVQIHVEELENEAIQNSAAVHLSDITAEEFIRRDKHGKTKHGKFKELLAKILLTKSSDVMVFSVTNIDGKQIDVRFAVRDGSSYYRPEKLHAEMEAFKNEVQSALQLSISQIEVDECRRANCSEGSGCKNYLAVSDIPTVVDTGSVSFVSVTTTTSAVCTCSARDRVHHSCSSYPQSPCLNGGVCIDTLNGYRCLCPASFHGPDCQQTKHSFHGNGYAWFHPIRPCFESSLSLEFITVVPDGLLLYSGPLSNPEPASTENFIAIELSGGIPVLKMSHGSGFVMLQFPSHLNVADKKWHQLEVRTSGQNVRFILDQCSAALVSEIEGVGKWLSTEDRTNCEVFGSVPRRERYLHVNHVLQLGGVKESLPYSYPQLLHKHFSGCLRNFILDTQVYDLQSPAESLNSFPGCTLTDGSCETMGSSSCGVHGRCLGDWGSFACQCLPGYYGYQCDKVANEYTFGPGSHIRYQLPISVPARRTLFEAMIRTRQPDGVIASMLSRNKDEYITLQVVQGLLVVSYNLGDGDYSVSLPSYRIDNGEWHHITLERNENEFTLRLYEGGGKREIRKAAGMYKEIVIDPSSLVLGNTHLFNQNRSFQGCMKDVRFNNYRIPLDTHVKDLVSVLSAQGIKEGCSSEACRNNPCNQEFICIDLWMMHECSCPPGYMIMENATGRQCVHTACAKRPCKYGTCISQSPAEFQCRCPDGYTGHTCEVTLAVFRKDTGLSFRSMFAICICFLALLALLGAGFLWAHWKTRKGVKRGVYHVSAQHEGLEDEKISSITMKKGVGSKTRLHATWQSCRCLFKAVLPIPSARRKNNQQGWAVSSVTSPGTQEQTRPPVTVGASWTSADFCQCLSDAV
ncbi:neural-cadherin-like [Pezoporus flaviventris]|uniref:neural-cadherin-like n=1 Tax=Pezoporus flaviventris TaxID=889875 RepID=UPI002AB0389E|nr:neural-cadherin-like [Pezoporus flaviventris]